VVRIPAGATNIDVRQHSYSGKPEDDNYLGELQCTFQSWMQLFSGCVDRSGCPLLTEVKNTPKGRCFLTENISRISAKHGHLHFAPSLCSCHP